jgi:hypothetical protein
MLRKGLTPFLFVLNNDGYEIERQIHGVRPSQSPLSRWCFWLPLTLSQVNAKYNDIQPYNHSLLLDFLAGPPKEGQAKKHAFHKVSTRAELEALLANKEFASANVCNLVEIMMPRGDAPVSPVSFPTRFDTNWQPSLPLAFFSELSSPRPSSPKLPMLMPKFTTLLSTHSLTQSAPLNDPSPTKMKRNTPHLFFMSSHLTKELFRMPSIDALCFPNLCIAWRRPVHRCEIG